MDQGYVKIWRKSLKSGLMKNPNLWMFWSWCLLNASWKEHQTLVGYQIVDLKPGQLLFSRSQASQTLGMSEKTIRTCLDALKKMGSVAVKSASKYSIISILNWDVYQDQDAVCGPARGQQAASKGPASGQQKASKGPALIMKTNKVNKERIYPSSGINAGDDNSGREGEKLWVNSEELTPKESVSKKEPYPGPFLEFWNAYPKKVGKGDAYSAYKKIKSPRPGLSEILTSIKAHKKTDQWKTKTFIPNPATFLNQRRWEDEFTQEDYHPPVKSRGNTPNIIDYPELT
jgi:biotin operon repressor